MKIRAKKGYNIVLNDLNVALSSNGKTIEVDEEKFNLSTDAKQLQKFIEIVDTENDIDINTKSIKSNSISINKAANNAFVAGNPIPNNPIPNKAINESSTSNETNDSISQPSQKIEKTNNTYIVKTKGEKAINNAVIADVNNESKQLVKKAKMNKNSQNKESELTKSESIKNEPVKNESLKNESIKNEPVKNESVKSELIKSEPVKKIDENTNKK